MTKTETQAGLGVKTGKQNSTKPTWLQRNSMCL